MCAIDGCEPWSVVRHEQRTAGKEHACSECHRTIRRGERHEYTAGRTLDTPQWLTSRTCAHCQAAGRWLDVMCGGWPIGVLYDELRDHWEEGYASPVPRAPRRGGAARLVRRPHTGP